jgi:hypothetical protein
MGLPQLYEGRYVKTPTPSNWFKMPSKPTPQFICNYCPILLLIILISMTFLRSHR